MMGWKIQYAKGSYWAILTRHDRTKDMVHWVKYLLSEHECRGRTHSTYVKVKH